MVWPQASWEAERTLKAPWLKLSIKDLHALY